MLNKDILSKALEKLPDSFSIGTLIDCVEDVKNEQNWIVYYNPVIMTDDTTNCLYGVLMNKCNPILCAEDHIQAIEDKLYKAIMAELNYNEEDEDFDESELEALVGWADGTLSNFDEENVSTPNEFYNEIINCDNFYNLSSELRDLWRDIDLKKAREFNSDKFRAKNEKEIESVKDSMEQGVAIFNEHLASIFADDDTDDNDE